MPPVWRLQPPRYNFGVFTLQPSGHYTLSVLKVLRNLLHCNAGLFYHQEFWRQAPSS
jgi:hypothetical protein